MFQETIVKPKTLVERARMNVGWLDSSLSIMEQGVAEFDTLLLRLVDTHYTVGPIKLWKRKTTY